MLSLSQTTGYAILALGCIASWKGQRVLARQVQKCTGISMPYLRKLLYALGKAGLIETKRGYRGGLVLARPAEKITLLDVVQAVEHENPLPDCLLGLPGCCEAVPCPMRNFWEKERARIKAKLGRITIAQAARSVVAARWGRLISCPSEEAPPEPRQRQRATRPAWRKGTPATAKPKKPPPAPRKRR